MAFISYETFVKYANPAIIAVVENEGNFEDFESLTASTISQITQIDEPSDTADTPKWLIPNIVAVITKMYSNKMQQLSDDLRKQINDNYDAAIVSLNAFRVGASNVSVYYSMPGMIKTYDQVGDSEWSVYD